MATFELTTAQKQQYQEEGYLILERVIPDEQLEVLRGECQHFIDLLHEQMDRDGSDVIGISHRNKRYFVSHPSLKSTRLREFLLNDLMTGICCGTIGPDAYIYWEQYVVKAAEVGMKFGWHQDSAFGAPAPHRPYVSCWCALDDMTEENGTIYVLPYSSMGTRDLVPHVKEEGSNDLIGYSGDDPGIPVFVPAGSVAVFSSYILHRSGTNTTDRPRRVYLAQYSPEPMFKADGSGPLGQRVPVLKDGRRVVDQIGHEAV
jgi:ectoine hydroxylase-related dioxygenase (phytanoyl-CoA dioxygenase family)